MSNDRSTKKPRKESKKMAWNKARNGWVPTRLATLRMAEIWDRVPVSTVDRVVENWQETLPYIPLFGDETESRRGEDKCFTSSTGGLIARMIPLLATLDRVALLQLEDALHNAVIDGVFYRHSEYGWFTLEIMKSNDCPGVGSQRSYRKGDRPEHVQCVIEAMNRCESTETIKYIEGAVTQLADDAEQGRRPSWGPLLKPPQDDVERLGNLILQYVLSIGDERTEPLRRIIKACCRTREVSALNNLADHLESKGRPEGDEYGVDNDDDDFDDADWWKNQADQG